MHLIARRAARSFTSFVDIKSTLWKCLKKIGIRERDRTRLCLRPFTKAEIIELSLKARVLLVAIMLWQHLRGHCVNIQNFNSRSGVSPSNHVITLCVIEHREEDS